MCIIVAKNKLTKLPKETYLQNCFDNNPDGAGFMYTKNGRVIIDKGYMTFRSFIKRYHKLCKRFNNFENKALVMHFRIGTAGANSPQNTHPYPVTDNKKLLHKTYVKTGLGVVHNGIISQYNPEKHIKDVNDTQNFIMKYLYPLYSNYRTFYKNEFIMDGISDITNSRLVFLDTNDTLSFVGEFEKDENGVLYSNSTYKTDWYSYYNKYYYGDYVKDEEDKPNYETELQLEPNWYISVEGKEFEKVGDRQIIYDYYSGFLYEIDDVGDTIRELGWDAEIFDENGEEIIL